MRNLKGSMRKLLCAAAVVGALAVAATAFGPVASAQAQAKKVTIALVPGRTTGAFCINMRKGAQAAADALGVIYCWPGSPDWNLISQIPVLNAVIALDTSLDPERRVT